jgi:hypothetical protein
MLIRKVVMVQINELRDCCFEMTTDSPSAPQSGLTQLNKPTWQLFASRLKRELSLLIESSKRLAKK